MASRWQQRPSVAHAGCAGGGAPVAASIPAPAGAGTVPLTHAEERVLRLVARARTNKEIAAALGISPATVKRHIEKILSKLQVRNRVEAAIYGLTAMSCPHRASSGCALAQIDSDD